jgi:hypothetical protein
MAESQEARRIAEIRNELRKGQSYVTPGGLKYWPALDSFNALLAEQDELRERIRLKMIEAGRRTTEARDTFEDGYFNGLASALDEFSAPPVKAATDEGEPRPIKPSGSRAPDQQGFQHG